MKKEKDISRRTFLKLAGAAGIAGAGLTACKHSDKATDTEAEVPTGAMTYRTNPTSGDRVSLLGFGMMRLPSVGGRSAREGSEEIDQEMVNELVDYALAHGVGMGSGMKEFENRYLRNGLLDFLLEERRAGRIRNLGFSYHGDVAVFDRLLAEHERYRWDFVQIQLNYLDWKQLAHLLTLETAEQRGIRLPTADGGRHDAI